MPDLSTSEPSASALMDGFGRLHDNLRISVTDRCNLRCVYCMAEEVTFLDREHLLRFEEIEQFARVALSLGLTKLRLTGGEPLMRRDLPRLVALLAAIPGLRDISLTTNGLLLAGQARALFDAGLRRINISLDTLDDERFRLITRREGLYATLAGIDAALHAGFHPVKVNAVIVRGLNDQDIVPLAKKARTDGYEMRYIEYMPIGAEPWERHKVVLAHEILDTLEAAIGPLQPVADYDPRHPAMEFEYVDGGGRVGIIASVSRPFCRSCNRLRLTCDGKLRACLFALEETDIKPYLRNPFDPQRLKQAIRACVAGKWQGHEINTARFIKPLRTMHAIGG
ncbi:MAG: GTP 3',8-cyclase MoaA [Gemmataceae bacterium]